MASRPSKSKQLCDTPSVTSTKPCRTRGRALRTEGSRSIARSTGCPSCSRPNRPGNHALGRVKTALSEQDARVTRLTSSLADVRLQAQKDIANMVLSRFFHSMGARCLGSAFFIWKQETRVDESQKEIDAIKASLRAQQRRLLARFLVSLRSGILGKVFVSWHQYVIAGKDADEVLRRVKEEREAHRQRLIKRTLARIKYGQLGRAFQAWGVGVVQRRKRRADMAHAMGRWQFRKRAAAFQTWCENAWDRIRARELMVKVLKRCDNVATAKAVSTWRGHLMRQKRDKIMKERLMMRMSNNLASTSELRSIIGMVMREAVSLIDADRATLFLYDGKKQHLYTLSGLGLETVSKESARGPRTGAAAILDLDDDEDGDDKKLDTITESRSITRAGIEGRVSLVGNSSTCPTPTKTIALTRTRVETSATPGTRLSRSCAVLSASTATTATPWACSAS